MTPFTQKSLWLAVWIFFSQDDWTPYHWSHLTLQLIFFVGNECIRATLQTYDIYVPFEGEGDSQDHYVLILTVYIYNTILYLELYHLWVILTKRIFKCFDIFELGICINLHLPAFLGKVTAPKDLYHFCPGTWQVNLFGNKMSYFQRGSARKLTAAYMPKECLEEGYSCWLKLWVKYVFNVQARMNKAIDNWIGILTLQLYWIRQFSSNLRVKYACICWIGGRLKKWIYLWNRLQSSPSTNLAKQCRQS